MTSATTNVFDRPELLDNQTRLILSAHVKPKRLVRSATRSAGPSSTHFDSDLPMASSFTPEINDDSHEDMQLSVQNTLNYDTDIEQEEEPKKDFSCKGLYLDQCHRHGVIPSTYFLRHIDNKSLTIRYSGLKPINIKVMIPSLKMNANITKLDLRDNGLGSNGATYIAQLIEDNGFITELNLADNDIGLQGCIALCSVLRSNRTVRTLYLDGNRFHDECAPHFAELFVHNDYIKYLNLNKNYFENETTGRLFGQALAENQTMEEFSVAWNRLRSKSCTYLIKSLASNACLTTFDLSWNGAGVLTAKAILEFFKINSTLEIFRLDNNQLNTECATYIGQGLAHNETVKVLTLNGNPLESSGCYAVLRSLMKHPNSQLQILDLRGIIVNKDFIELTSEISTILPHLTVKLGRERECTI
ncbi:unnamed protein product [Adineta ricciae]|uniref:Uncharacterized protein n=1 Tax=Adineta ricciae TaxID=249248 RepID=A0A815PI57_ADIRI|nr:unnamed protein product [Adineta ricciae]